MTVETLKTVSLIFENCNSLILDAKEYVNHLYIGDITEDVWSNWCQQLLNRRSAKFAYLSLNPSVFNLKTAFEEQHEMSGDTVRQHLVDWHDITNIEVEDIEGRKQYISVPWGNEEYKNTEQVTTVGEDEIEIEIGKLPE